MRIGDVAPDFELRDDNGVMRTLNGLLGDGPVVLFFYPAALSPGCTAESCHFRDLAAEFTALGATRVGISADPVSRQRDFTDKHTLGFPLLSDPDREVAQQFGARRGFGPLAVKRLTFVIDTDRRIIDIIKSETRMSAHVDRALTALRQRSGARGPAGD